MRIVVAGGTGTLGQLVLAEAKSAGHDAVSASRSSGLDAQHGRGVDAALEGADVVIDVIDRFAFRRATAVDQFHTAAANLVQGARRADVRRYVLVSIVGVDDPRLARLGYYQGKLAQERVVAESTLSSVVLRTTQWYEFADKLLSMTPGPIAVAPRALVQPIAARAVARELVRLADPAAAVDSTVHEMGGPETMTLVDLVRRVLRHRGRRRPVLPVPIPHGRAADGPLLPGPDAVIDPTTLTQWLESDSAGPSHG